MLRRFVITSVFITILVHGGVSFAQWTKIYDFSAQVSSIYFLDLPGSPRIGFIGTDDGVNEKLWKTTDGGITWNPKLNQPHQGTWFYPSSVSFKDSLHGWCSLYGGIYETRDGGQTWIQILADTGLFTVYYCPYNSYIYKGPITSEYSTDEGATWRMFDSRNIDVGYMMNANGVGVATHYGPYASYLITRDFGKTWLDLGYQMFEAFQGISIPGTNIFFVVHDSDWWSQLSDVWGLNPSGMGGGGGGSGYLNPRTSTGCIAGTLCELYVQTSDGIVVSTDSGWNWTFIGGPGNLVDTRFFVKGEDVYAGDEFGGLWHLNQEALAPSLQTALNEDTIELGNFNNCSKYDTSFSLANLLTCDDIVIDSIYMGTSPAIIPTSVPSGFHALKIGMADTIKLHFNPIGDTSFLSSVNVVAQLDSQKYVFHIPVRASSYTNRNALIYPHDTLHAQACVDSVSFLQFTNNGCHPLVIDSISTPPDLSISSSNFPRRIDSGTIIGIHLNSSQSGDRNESLTVYYHIYNGVDTLHLDSTLTILVEISPGIPTASFSTSSLDFGMVSTCGGSATLPVVLSSTGCDTLTCNATAPSTPFLLAKSFSSALPVGMLDTALVTFTPTQPGAFYDTIVITTNAGIDTVPIRGLGVPGLVSLNVPATTLSLPQVIAGCYGDTLLFSFSNAGCASITIDSVTGLTLPFSSSPISNLPLATGDTATFNIYYTPSLAGSQSETTHIYYHGPDGVEHDTVVTIAATAIEPPNVSVFLKPGSLSAVSQGMVSIPVYAVSTTSATGVGDISFRLDLRTDLLTPESIVSPIVGSGTAPLQTDANGTTFNVTLPAGFTISSDTILATVSCRAYVTDTIATTINLTSASSSDGRAQCLSFTSGGNESFTFVPECGTTELTHYLATGSVFSILSIVPNPAQNEIRVSVTGLTVSGMGVELFDMLGRQQDAKPTLLPNEIVVDVSSIPAGAYYLRLAASGYVQTRKVSIER